MNAVIEELKEQGNVSSSLKRKLAAKVFRHTAAYDALIAEYMTQLAEEEEPERVTFTYELKQSAYDMEKTTIWRKSAPTGCFLSASTWVKIFDCQCDAITW